MKRSHKTKFKKIVSGMLAAAMSISLLATVPVSAETGKTTYTYDGYSVEYNVTNEWEGNQTVEITVSNTGDESILNWALKYDAEGEISNLWNANIYEQTESDYVVKNVGWNYEIAPNQSVIYGYTLSGENISVPETFEMYSKRVDVTEGYDVKCNYNQVWDTGVQGELVITNTSDTPIEAWTLSFDTNFVINNLWNGRILENTDTSYVVASQMWTNPIQPFSSTTIGFVGDKEVDIDALLNNFKLTAVVIGEGIPVVPVDPSEEKIEITANAEYNEENGNVTVSWITTNPNGIFDILMSPDGENFTSVGTVENVSEFVYTPATDFEAYHFKVVQKVGEQSAESNVVSVVKPVEDIVISAEAVYDEDSGNVTIKWTTNNENGTFEIIMSNDGENFASVDSVESVSEYIYTPTEDFETLYFQVKQTYKNQAAESNVVAVANSAEDIAISAEAAYDTENGNVIVEWTSNKENGIFEIFVSEDGESYTSIAVVEDVVEYVYTPENEFEVLYFKVKQTTGLKSAESNIAIISYPIDWEDETDTDSDGLTDVYEKYYYETEFENPDTDGDKLPDGYEVYYLGTDPLKIDSNDNDICDGDEDFDEDGLSNLEEYQYATNPLIGDTDYDDLSDYDEVNTHNTDPNLDDSDGDKVLDGDEIELGLNPNSDMTNGILDNERTFEQTISSDSDTLYFVNTENNPFEVSIDITASGIAENNFTAEASGYNYIMKNEAVLGVAPEFSYTDGLKIEDVVVNFNVDDSIIDNSNSKYATVSDEFAGIKRFNVFKYFEDTNMLLPIETFHDIEQNKVYAHTDELGTYCLVDMEMWLASLGIIPEAAQMQVMTLSDTPKTITNKVAKGDNLDVIFVIYSNSAFLKYAKTELISAASEIFNEAEKQGVTARIHFVAWNGGLYSNLNTGTQYAENINDATAMINKTTAINTASLTSVDYMLTKAINGIRGELQGNLLENSKKYCFIIDSGCNPACSSTNGGIDALKETGMDFSFIYAPGNANVTYYNALSTDNSTYQMVAGNGRLAFYEFVFDHMFDRKEQVYKIISSSGLVELPEDFGEINYNSNEDYDKDGLTDAEEIYFDAIDESGNNIVTVNADGSVTLPSFNECIAVKGTYVEAGLKRFYDDAGESILNQLDEIKVLPIISDPLSEDGDGDGILDLTEYEIMQRVRNTANMLTSGNTKDSVQTAENPDDKINPALSNSIVTLYGFNSITDMFDSETIDDETYFKAYTLANEKGLSFTEDTNKNDEEDKLDTSIQYGILGVDTDAFYLEAYSELNEDGSITNELRINSNLKFSKNLNHDRDGKLKSVTLLTNNEELNRNEIITRLKEEWSGSFEGSDHDFYKDMVIDVSVAINVVEDNKRYINNTKTKQSEYKNNYAEIKLIEYDNRTKEKVKKTAKNPHTSMKLNGNVIMSLYTMRYDTRISKAKYRKQRKEDILSVASHEFGHVLGLFDAYGDVCPQNYWLEIVWQNPEGENYEASFDEIKENDMMNNNEKVSANNIEMVIFARKADKDAEERGFQVFYPQARACVKDDNYSDGYKTTEIFKRSEAIKRNYIYFAHKQTIINGVDIYKGEYYYYDSSNNKYINISTITKDKLLEIIVKDKIYTKEKAAERKKLYTNYIDSIKKLKFVEK